MDQNEKIKRDKKGLLVLLLLLVAVISGTFAVTFSRYYPNKLKMVVFTSGDN